MAKKKNTKKVVAGAQTTARNTKKNKNNQSWTSMIAVVAVAIALLAFLGGGYFMNPQGRNVDKALAEMRQAEESYITDNAQWLETNKTKPGVVTLPSGLQYKVIKQGTGKVATPDNDVTVRYEGRLIDGTVFDSSYKRNPNTTSFKPTQVIKGWTEALCMMPEGSKWELYIPRDLGYGSQKTGGIPAFSTLIFTVEVVEVK